MTTCDCRDKLEAALMPKLGGLSFNELIVDLKRQLNVAMTQCTQLYWIQKRMRRLEVVECIVKRELRSDHPQDCPCDLCMAVFGELPDRESVEEKEDP